MSDANGAFLDTGNVSDGTPIEKSIDPDDNTTVIKTESCCSWDERHCEDVVDLSENNFDQSDNVMPRQSDNIRRSASQGQRNSDNLPAAEQQIGHIQQIGNSANSFECQQCNSQLGTFEQFIKHMRTAHLQHWDSAVSAPSSKCQCHLCGRQLASTSGMEFNTHLAEHLLDTRTKWHCGKCHGKHFDGATELREHLTQCHVHLIFRCAICLELFTEKYDLEDHLMTHHCVKQQKFLCAACEMPFDSRFAFHLHIGQVHAAECHHSPPHHRPSTANGTGGGKEMKQEEEQNGTSRSGTSGGTGPKNGKVVPVSEQQQRCLKCVVCDMRCPDELSLDQHRLFEHCKVPRADRCGVCRRPLDSIAAFVQHSLAHRNPTNEEVHCAVCRQLIRGEVQLKMHGQYHLEGTEGQQHGDKMGAESGKRNEDIAKADDDDGGRADGQEVLLEQDGADAGGDEPRALSPAIAVSDAASAADNAEDGTTISLPLTMPTVKCPSCDMQSVQAEDYGKHLLLHAMVGSLADFGVFGTFGDNAYGTACAQSVAQRPRKSQMDLPMGCARCERTFDTFVGLNSHMLDHLRENVGGGARKSPTIATEKHRSGGRSDPLPDCPRRPIECDKCGQTFASMARFIVHRRRHKMERTLAKCRICDRRFASKAQLDQHTAEHSAKLQQLTGMRDN